MFIRSLARITLYATFQFFPSRCLSLFHSSTNPLPPKVIIFRHYSSFTKRVVYTRKPLLNTMKFDTPEFKALFTPELDKLVSLFTKYDYELRIAGGAVRDLLLGQVPHDLDFATTATPNEMKDMFTAEGVRMLNMHGEKHGTITCRINDKENFEVTTLRIDVTTDGRHAEVQFTKDWALDSLRRDLTINSMFLGFDGTLYDYFCGKEDLANRHIQFVGDAVARIQEDYLRILRYFRFYGRIAKDPNAHDASTLTAIRDNMHGLADISGERLWVELKKIVVGNHAGNLMEVMLELGMAKYIGLPENSNVAEFVRVWNRSHDLDLQPLTLLAALLPSEEKVYKLNERLKISKDEIRLGLFIVEHRHDDFGVDGGALKRCKDILCDTAGKEPRTKDRICELLKYLNLRDVLKDFNEYEAPKFPIKGHELLERGVEKGPQLAKVLNALRNKWKESDYQLSGKELLSLYLTKEMLKTEK